MEQRWQLVTFAARKKRLQQASINDDEDDVVSSTRELRLLQRLTLTSHEMIAVTFLISLALFLRHRSLLTTTEMTVLELV